LAKESSSLHYTGRKKTEGLMLRYWGHRRREVKETEIPFRTILINNNQDAEKQTIFTEIRG
jgi:hypothetical protein